MDGGTMFGLVPKVLWSRYVRPDDDNNLDQDTNCLLVDTGAHKVLIDTGYGGQLSEKERQILAAQAGTPLLDSLRRVGVAPEDIDTVILSHLHFDHVGGATMLDEDGRWRPTFVNARYVVQRHEWMFATADLPELRGAYAREQLLVLRDSGSLCLIDGRVEIVPGVSAIPTGGHSPGHQAIRLESAGAGGVYLGDLCPTPHHLPVRWGTSYDLDLLQLRRSKAALLATIAARGSLAFFDHDPHTTHARLRCDKRRDFAVKQEV